MVKYGGNFYIAGSYRHFSSGVRVEVDKKYHVALTYDGSDIKIYVNGQLGNTVEVSGIIKEPVSNTVMALGVNPGGNNAVSSFFRGKIYNAAIYNTAISAEQVISDYGKTLTYGQTIGTLPTPTRAGYTFDGWWTEPTGGTQITTLTPVPASDTTYYARWTANNYTITYDNNYLQNDLFGTKGITPSVWSAAATAPTNKVAVDNTTAYYGKEMQFTMPNGVDGGPYVYPQTEIVPGKTYTWSVYLKMNCNKKLLVGHERGGYIPVDVTTSWQRFTYTFTAKENNVYAFIFYARQQTTGSVWNAGDVLYVHSLEIAETPTLNISTQNKIYGNNLGVLPTPTRTGYTFEGWWTEPTGGSQISTSTTVPATNTTYYAHWTANSYTVNLDANGGTIPTTSGWTITTNGDSKVSARKSITYGTTYGTLPTPTRTGYTFNGWYSGQALGDIIMPAINGAYHHQAIAYNIQPGVTYTITIDNATCTSGSATSFTSKIYDFTDGRDLAIIWTIPFGNNKTFSLTCPADVDVTHQLRILFYSGIQGNTENNAVTFTNVKIGTDGTSTATQYTSTSTLNIANNHVLFAKWTINNYTVTYDYNYGIDNMTDWYLRYPTRFNITYDSNSNMNTVACTGASGWETIYYPITTIVGQTYNLAFDYEIPASYAGNVRQQVLTAAVLDNTNNDNAIINQSLPNTKTSSKQTYSATFTATTTTTYITFNYGFATDGYTATLKLGNFKITQLLLKTYGETLGTLPDISRDKSIFNGWYTAPSGGSKISSSTAVPNNNVTYYAQWTHIKNNMKNWSSVHSSQFSVTNNNNMNTVACTTVTGWESIYYPITTVVGQTYTITFDYEVLTSYNTIYGFSGIGYQALTKITDNDNDGRNGTYSLETKYFPKTTTSSQQTTSLTFTATTTTTYIAFNFGMAADNQTIRLNLGNFRISHVDSIMSNWTLQYGTQFNTSYDTSTNMNTISCTTISGWEMIYYPITTVVGQTYSLAFDYEIPTSYSGNVDYQILTAISNNQNTSNQIFGQLLPNTSTSSKQTFYSTFTATTTTTYVAFNFGWANDGQTVTLKLGNFRISP